MKMIHFIGVDVSKKTLDVVVIRNGEIKKRSTLENVKKGIEQFLRELKKELLDFDYATTVICMEHTGIYSYLLLDVLTAKEAFICLEPGLQIKQSLGMQRGKNDRVDAQRIAQYAYKNQQELRFWKPSRVAIQKIRALLTLRERLVTVRSQLEVPLREGSAFIDASIQKSIKENCKSSVKALEKDIEKVEKEIKKIVDEDETLKTQFKIVTSVIGIGPVTGAMLIVATDEFKRFNDPKKFACYAGVAPFEHTSGTSVRGKTRVSRLANKSIKKLLHLAAMCAIRFCAELKAYYERKVREGKKPMAVINSVRNKLITRVFACIRDQREYQKEYKNALV
jgi:transposase